MYILSIEKKIREMLRGMRITILISSVFIPIMILLVVSDGKIINTILILLFALIYFTMFFLLYNFISYRLVIDIIINHDKINIIFAKKEMVINKNEIIKKYYGVHNVILVVEKNKKRYKFYIPKKYGYEENIDENAMSYFDYIKPIKTSSDIGVRFM